MPPTAETLRTFVAMYIVGNFICLAASGFLLGPKQQCVKMWDETRRFSTAFYLIMLIVVFAVAVAVSVFFFNYTTMFKLLTFKNFNTYRNKMFTLYCFCCLLKYVQQYGILHHIYHLVERWLLAYSKILVASLVVMHMNNRMEENK